MYKLICIPNHILIWGYLYLDIWSWIPGSGQPPGNPILFLNCIVLNYIFIWDVCTWISGAEARYCIRIASNFIFDIKIEILSQINTYINIQDYFSILGCLDLDTWIRTASMRWNFFLYQNWNSVPNKYIDRYT